MYLWSTFKFVKVIAIDSHIQGNKLEIEITNKRLDFTKQIFCINIIFINIFKINVY